MEEITYADFQKVFNKMKEKLKRDIRANDIKLWVRNGNQIDSLIIERLKLNLQEEFYNEIDELFDSYKIDNKSKL